MSNVIIIGGGAAGMMAAITAARNNNKVTLIEKNEKLGKKLLLPVDTTVVAEFPNPIDG